MVLWEMVRPKAETLGQGLRRPRPDLQSRFNAPGGFDGSYPHIPVLPLGYLGGGAPSGGGRVLIADPDSQWIHPNRPLTWACAHEKEKDPGHTSLYIIYALTSDDVLYVGITNNLQRRFKEHRKKKPWWHNSERASLECYTTWDDAAEAERSRIETWQPLYNIAANAQRAVNCTTCEVCGYPIKYGELDWNEEVPTQHEQCNEAITDAYMAGSASMYPKDDPYRDQVRAVIKHKDWV